MKKVYLLTLLFIPLFLQGQILSDLPEVTTANDTDKIIILVGNTTNYLTRLVEVDNLFTGRGGTGTMIYPGAGIPLSTGLAWGTSITDNSTNWNTAYTDRLKWDGGATGLVAATGRTSLGATTLGSSVFTVSNYGGIGMFVTAADNSVAVQSAAELKTTLGFLTGVDTASIDSRLQDLESGGVTADSSFVSINFVQVASLASAAKGDVYYDSDNDLLLLYNGSSYDTLNQAGSGGGGGSDTMLVTDADTLLLDSDGMHLTADSIFFSRQASSFYQFAYISPTGSMGFDSIVQPAGFMLEMDLGLAIKDLRNKKDGEVRWWYEENDTIKEVYGYPEEPLMSKTNQMFMGRIEKNLMYISRLEIHTLIQYLLIILLAIYVKRKL